MMAQRDSDRLVVLKKAQKRLITQAMAAAEPDGSDRQVRRLPAKLAVQGDRAVVHGLRDRPPNRKLDTDNRHRIDGRPHSNPPPPDAQPDGDDRVRLLTGGYPEALARSRTRDSWFRSSIQTYLERDSGPV